MIDLTRCHRVLVFGGTFDPPHVGHVTLPELARQVLDADAVAYVPAAVSPFKTDQPPTPAVHRLAMLRLALRDQPHAAIVTDELDRAAGGHEPSYTVDTLERLRQRLGEQVTLRLLIGADQLRAFDRWKNWRRIVELAEPAVMVRPPETRDSILRDLPAGFDRDTWARRVVELPLVDVSSSDVRRRVREGQPLGDRVSPAVAEYICEHGLYRQGE